MKTAESMLPKRPVLKLLCVYYDALLVCFNMLLLGIKFGRNKLASCTSVRLHLNTTEMHLLYITFEYLVILLH